MSSVKVLYLSYDGLTDPLGQSQILPYVVGLSGKGYRFTLISFEKKEKFEKLNEEINQVCQSHSVRWVPLQYHKKPPVLSTLFDLYQLWKTVQQEYKINHFQIVHCRSYITSLIGLKAKRKWNVKFIFDMRGFWADERVEGGLWNLRNPVYNTVYKFFKKNERLFLNESDHIVSLTHNAKKEIESWGVNTPITVIPTCVDLDLFDPSKIKKEDQTNLRVKLGVNENDFVLLYLGSWGTWYLTDDMLDFFVALKKEKLNAKFLIVSADQIDLGNYIHKEDVIINSVPRDQVPLYISLAQASVCFIKPTFSKKASSATKVGEIMAMNGLVVTNAGWGDIDNVEVYGRCKILPEASAKLFKEYIDYLSTLTDSEMRKKEFPDQLSIGWGVKSYLSVYDQLFKLG